MLFLCHDEKMFVSVQGITGLRQSKILNDGNPSVSASFFIWASNDNINLRHNAFPNTIKIKYCLRRFASHYNN